MLKARHLFGDHALLRRTLFDGGLVSRSVDGREYRRERKPPAEAIALIQYLSARKTAGQPRKPPYRSPAPEKVDVE
jgi:Uncharacterized protein conserved in bacteria (DUF2087)